MRNRIGLIILLVAVLIGVAACAQPSPQAVEPVKEVEKAVVGKEAAVTATSAPGAPRYGGTAIVLSGTKVLNLDAAYGESGDDVRIDYHIYDTLVRYKHGTMEIEPALAESWEVSEDGKTWTFHLRKGVKFHDGTPFNADAVLFNYNRLLDENDPLYHVGGSWSYFNYLLEEDIQEIKKVDDFTVQIILKDKFAPLLVSLAYYAAGIASPTALEQWKEEYPNHPVGTGPFKFEEWVTDQYVSVVANEDYWGGRPYLDKIIFKEVPEASTRLLELQGGKAHVLTSVLPEQMGAIRDEPDLELVQVPGANLSWMIMNQNHPPFDNVLVRKAINYAVDVDTIVKELWGGAAVRAVNPYPDTMPCWNPDTKPYEYNPQKAKELLAEAGYPDGFEMEIIYADNPRPYLPDPPAVAAAIASYLQEVGIKARLTEMEWGTMTDLAGRKEIPTEVIGWYDIPEPNNFMNAMLLQAGYSSAPYPDRMYELAEKAIRTYDMDERCKYYMEMQEIYHEQADRLPLAHSMYTDAVSKKLRDFVLSVDGTDLLLWAWLEE